MWEEFLEIANSTEITPYTSALRILVSLLLGALIGAERQTRRREAGMRTFTLICMGSTLAMLISIWIPQTYTNFLNGDPGRIAAQVLTGIGFLGAGAIIKSNGSIYGLTTAACIWATAVIGLAAGAGMYIIAASSTLVVIIVLFTLERFERRVLLDGVNKILTISCNTSSPDLKAIRRILESDNIYIVSLSYEHNYDKNTSVITYKVNVKAKSSYMSLFNELRQLGYIAQIKLLA